MYSTKKINALRIERNLSQNRLLTLEKNLDTGTYNTRKYQLDSEKIERLKNRIVEINTEIHSETAKLNRVKFARINTSEIPILKSMFVIRSPPKKGPLAEKPEDQLNKTFEAQTTEANTPKSIDDTGIFQTEKTQQPNIPRTTTYPYIEDVIENDPFKQTPTTSKNTDFQHFVQKTVGLGTTSGGTLPKVSKKLDFSFPTEQFNKTTQLSQPQVTQIHKTPITLEIPKRTASFADDFYALRPPTFQLPSPKRLNIDYSTFQKDSLKEKLPQFQANIIEPSQRIFTLK